LLFELCCPKKHADVIAFAIFCQNVHFFTKAILNKKYTIFKQLLKYQSKPTNLPIQQLHKGLVLTAMQISAKPIKYSWQKLQSWNPLDRRTGGDGLKWNCNNILVDHFFTWFKTT